VYPLSDTDVFSDTRDNTGKVFGINSIHYDSSNQWTIELDHLAGDLFDADSPTQRIYIVKSPVAFCVADGSLYRFENYTLDNGSYVYPPVAAAVMADHIKQISASNLPFQYLPATLQRNAMLQINITFERADEAIVFHHDIHIANVP
jgi:MSHA biogenesis protein MshO